jgi:hypothetical protein
MLLGVGGWLYLTGHCCCQAPEVASRARAMAPPQHTATAASSTLCKLLAWDAEGVWQRVRLQPSYATLPSCAPGT